MNTSLMNQYTKNHYFYLATLYESVWYSLIGQNNIHFSRNHEVFVAKIYIFALILQQNQYINHKKQKK